ncbi:hypothetical protein, variant [Gaeumannomyces tritici R3-111a-1]|uniref:Uncharacterized protein n=1 Tax=Gaeumannomyces tritici (strain R3-111a-1) TaxID=644352 RepID=J3NVS9_GAET3|nr:hypothetical protein GGTG_05391 [Gaeumannomyces tritici R3-111a-1]XP_009221458.1 hypothetical protein, variant [Gaeumannomyces tritici R3-111a-1]EJT75457.1 hypothetical protein, variant [Gaeumannomyces tritici R3-111a-1]EJT75458.1 hypothetical protein GGTG_05391 [Gaeumannomyces tritici R3-111a-1]
MAPGWPHTRTVGTMGSRLDSPPAATPALDRDRATPLLDTRTMGRRLFQSPSKSKQCNQVAFTAS